MVFSTGTDEHGYKIQKKAAQENLKCLNFCDKISSNIEKKKLKKNFFSYL